FYTQHVVSALNSSLSVVLRYLSFSHAEDCIRDRNVTGVQTCALPISAVHAGTMTASAPQPHEEGPSVPSPRWRTRLERPEDAAALRDLLLTAFPTADEADLVESL